MKLYAKTALLLGSVFLAFALVAIALLNWSEAQAIEAEGLAQARTLNRAAFEALYASMRQGGGRQNNHAVIERLRQIEGIHEIRVLRGPPVERQFGVEPDEQPQDDLDRRALAGMTIQEVRWQDDVRVVRYVTPLFVETECQRCHRAEVGEVNGAISVQVSLAASDQMRAARRNALLGGVAAGLLALGLVTFWGMQWLVVQPLQRIRSGMAALAAGDSSRRLDPTGSDEIGELARAFETMRASLSAYRQQIEFLLERLGRSGEDADMWAERLAVLYATATALSRSLNLDELCRGFAAELRRLVRFDHLSVATLDENGAPSRACAVFALGEGNTPALSRSPEPVEGEAYAARAGETTVPHHALFSRRDGPAGWVVEHRRPFVCVDLREDERFPIHAALRREGFGSYVILPLLVRERLFGLLSLGSYQSHAYGREDFSFLESVAGQLAVAVENTQLYEESRHRAITDALTGLYNRRRLDERMAEEIERARRYGHSLSMLMIDIDHFKDYNDAHGHPQGDVALKELARLLQINVRATDLAARYGGEEFVVLLPETTKTGALALAEKVRAAVAEHDFPFEDTQPGGRLTVSLGVATFPEDIDEPADTFASLSTGLVRQADQALYRAKAEGRNRVCGA